ncbi:MAG: MarR family transcriptional regulator [Pseudomonadota bacterium]
MTAPAEQPASDLSKDRLRLWLKLLKASRAIEDEVRRRLRAEFGSTLPRFDVMSALDRAPDGLKMSEISKLLRVSNGNITGIVDKLTDEGMVLRVAIPGDRRAHLVRLTPMGKEKFRTHASAHQQWINEILAELNFDDVAGMNLRLDRLGEALEGGADD